MTVDPVRLFQLMFLTRNKDVKDKHKHKHNEQHDLWNM